MSALSRTPGLLTLGKFASAHGGPSMEYVNGSAQQQVFAAIPMEEFDHQANAQHLVNCWNALDGLPDDALDSGWNVRSMSAYTKGLEDKLRVTRDLLLALMKLDDRNSIADHDEGMPCTSPEFDDVMASVREALKGGVT